ncbi:MAG: tetratricopeptide repeat protein [Deltaproteobacteria bacterium]|nr:tetratricopeptide repeat protein [Deltaproteobacteria bacterium]
MNAGANNQELLQDPAIYQAFALMQRKEFDSAEALLKKGLAQAKNVDDSAGEGVFLSTLGILFKLKGDYKKAYKFYQQAEKCLKDDDSIKIISAVLLIEQFNQHETAFRKMAKLLDRPDQADPAIIHHATALQVRALLGMRKPEPAAELFASLANQDFAQLRFAANLDFKAVEALLMKGTHKDLCETYLKKALDLASKTKEEGYITLIKAILGKIDAL